MCRFSIKFAKTNQKFAENSEFCEKYSLLFKIIHWCPYTDVVGGQVDELLDVAGEVRAATLGPHRSLGRRVVDACEGPPHAPRSTPARPARIRIPAPKLDLTPS